MRIALLTTDNRDHQRCYGETVPRFGPAIEAILSGLSERPELEVHVISCTQKPMRAPAKLSENTWFYLLHVPKIGWLRTGYQGCVRAVHRKLRELQPDIVHGQGTERECAISAVLSGFPNVVTVHGNMGQVAKSLRAPIGSFLWLTARLETFALRRAGGVFCNSAYTEQLVRKNNARTWRVPNALRPAFFDTPLRPRVRSEKPILLNVGGIIPYKRQLELLEMAEQLNREGDRFEIIFVSPPPGRSAYARAFQERLAGLGSRGFARVVTPGNLDELMELYDRASALIHVSTEESFGLVVAEAMSRNLKFFGVRAGGVPDIAEGVEGAELFALEDEKSLISAISRWLESSAPLPKTAAQEMRTRYHPDVIAAQHVGIYREVISQGPGPHLN
jgi:glycosyltransferase involved in cell wall biosynthesis